jgi:hypothetical protein
VEVVVEPEELEPEELEPELVLEVGTGTAAALVVAASEDSLSAAGAALWTDWPGAVTVAALAVWIAGWSVT